jgi:hypothetical protein
MLALHALMHPLFLQRLTHTHPPSPPPLPALPLYRRRAAGRGESTVYRDKETGAPSRTGCCPFCKRGCVLSCSVMLPSVNMVATQRVHPTVQEANGKGESMC